MKPTVRVSIGGLAFNLEEDAYRVLNDYLQSLKNHFQDNVESNEIIADIESRLSELLQIRMSKNEGAVTLDDALDIIKIMGNPKDFGDGTSEETQTKKDEDDSGKDFFRKKRLFRDLENKVAGGVCGGFAHYFRVDVTIIRLIFIGLFLALFFWDNSRPSCFVMILVYAILWIIMPAARSFNQKLKMTGTESSIENIGDRPLQPVRKYRGSGITSVFNVLLNIVVGVIAILLFISLLATIASFTWFYFDTDMFASINYLVLFGYNTFNAKLAIVLVSIIPIIGLLWLMIKVLRRSPFTMSTFISFIIGFVIWLGSALYIGNGIAQFAVTHQKKTSITEEIALNATDSILYVKLGEEYLDAKEQPNTPLFLYDGNSMDKRRVCILPNVSVVEDTTITEYKLEVEKRGFGQNSVMADRNVEKMKLNYNLVGSSLIINPEWYNNDNPWKAQMYDLKIRVPKGKEVQLAPPLQERYGYVSFNFKKNKKNRYKYRSFSPFVVGVSFDECIESLIDD